MVSACSPDLIRYTCLLIKMFYLEHLSSEVLNSNRKSHWKSMLMEMLNVWFLVTLSLCFRASTISFSTMFFYFPTNPNTFILKIFLSTVPMVSIYPKEVKGLECRGGVGGYHGYIKTIEEHSTEQLIYIFQKCQYHFKNLRNYFRSKEIKEKRD